MIGEKLAAQADKSATCPQFTRRGCSLTARTDELLAQSKLAVSQWMELTQCLAGRLTLRRCAKRWTCECTVPGSCASAHVRR